MLVMLCSVLQTCQNPIAESTPGADPIVVNRVVRSTRVAAADRPWAPMVSVAMRKSPQVAK